MKTWFKKFWYLHGERIFFGGSAAIFAAGMLVAGKMYDLPQFVSTGEVVMTGVVMLMFNKARGQSVGAEEEK